MRGKGRCALLDRAAGRRPRRRGARDITIFAKPPFVSLHPTRASLVVEFLYTFALAWVVLNAATAQRNGRQFVLWTGNRFHGSFGRGCGPASLGGAFNRAVGLGVFVMGLGDPAPNSALSGRELLGGRRSAALAFQGNHDVENSVGPRRALAGRADRRPGRIHSRIDGLFPPVGAQSCWRPN